MKNSILILALLSICFISRAQCISGNCENGFGIFIFTDGGIYLGNFVNNIREGKGSFIWKDGSKYEGDWVNGKTEGNGMTLFTNGNKYIGSYKEGKFNGKGIFTVANSFCVEGIYKNGNFETVKYYDDKHIETTEELYSVQKKISFTDEYKNKFIASGCLSGDCVNGNGFYKWIYGEIYIGDFKDAKRDGIGTYTNSKGEVFAGAWKNGNWFESGCLTGDCKNGFGTYVSEYAGTTYIGQFKNGSSDGEGTSIKKDGTTHKGQWKKGHRDGEGTETNPDGITLTGNWDYEYLKGPGIETLPNGYYKTGKFKHYKCCPDNPKYYTKDNIEISSDKYEGLKNQFSVKENAEKVLAALPKCISGNCQNGYGVIKYSDGTKYFGMCKNGSCEGLGYFVDPDVTTFKYDDKDGRDPYRGLYSLKQVPVVTPGKITYGEWINGVKTRSFNNLEEFSNEVNKRNSAYEYSDGLYSINKSNKNAEAKQQKAEDDAAERAYYNNQMKNVSSTPSSSSSNETTVKTTTITKSGNEIIDFKTVLKQ